MKTLEHFVKVQLESTKFKLKQQLEYVVEDNETLQLRLDNNNALGLGGSLQNTWEIYRLLGLVEAYTSIQGLLNKK